MSRKGKTASKSTEQSIAKVELVVSFQVFFQEALTQNLVKSWQEREINAFFKDLGLSDKEPADKYKDALNKY